VCERKKEKENERERKKEKETEREEERERYNKVDKKMCNFFQPTIRAVANAINISGLLF